MFYPSSIFPAEFERTTAWAPFSPSFILHNGEPLPPWAGISDSFIRIEPPRRKRARRRKLSARAKSNAYSALLTVDTYAEEARQALRSGDDGAAVHALQVLLGVVQAALGLIRGPVLR
jgi:hypothetical protein